jgi:hypothetical protein
MPVYSPAKKTLAKKALNISQRIADVQAGYYPSMFRHIDSLGKEGEFKGDNDLYMQAKFIMANYTYLIYERLELKLVRDINYTQVRAWAAKNRILVRRLLTAQYPAFEIAAFDNWVQPDTQIQKIGMYSASTRLTKNNFH